MSAVVRGCGTRVKGGIYAVVGTSENGVPVEHFLCDPPVRVDKDELGLSSIGVKLIEVGGTYHVFDIVGRDSYPNVADFVEEVRRFGVSRRLPKTLDFAKLGPASRLVLLHERAHIDNFPAYFTGPNGIEHHGLCPKGIREHDYNLPTECCAGLWWQDVEGGGPAVGGRSVVRYMPSFMYEAQARPEGVEPEYELAIFARFPISNLAVVADPEGGSDEEALQAANRAALPVFLEAE